MFPRAVSGGAAGMELSPGEGVVVGRRQRSVWAPLEKRSSLRADQPPQSPEVLT